MRHVCSRGTILILSVCCILLIGWHALLQQQRRTPVSPSAAAQHGATFDAAARANALLPSSSSSPTSSSSSSKAVSPPPALTKGQGSDAEVPLFQLLRPSEKTEKSSRAVAPVITVAFLLQAHASTLFQDAHQDRLFALKAILQNTFQPYELFLVCDGCETTVFHEATALVQAHLTARAQPRWETFLKESAFAPQGLQEAFTAQVLHHARQNKVRSLQHAILAKASGNTLFWTTDTTAPTDFGYDKYMTHALRQSPQTWLVSGRCVFNGGKAEGDTRTTARAGPCDASFYDTHFSNDILLRAFASDWPLAASTLLAREAFLRLSPPSEPETTLPALFLNMGQAAGQQMGKSAAYVPISYFSLKMRQNAVPPFLKTPQMEERRSVTPLNYVDVPRTIVSAASPNHKASLRALYESLKRHEPRTRLVLYAMHFDDAAVHEMRKWPDVDVRVFNFTAFPAFMDVDQERGQYAWKGMMLQEMAREVGGQLLWLDAGDLVWNALNRNVWREMSVLGAYSTQTLDTIEKWVHPDMLSRFHVPDALKSRPMCNGATFGFHMLDPDAVLQIALPYFECMKEKACVAPEGSSRVNHRQDQAALTALLYTKGRGSLCEKWDNSKWIGNGVSPSLIDTLSTLTITMHNDQPGEGSRRCKDPATLAEYDC